MFEASAMAPTSFHLLITAIIVLLIFWLELVAGYWSPLLNFSAATRGLLFAVLKTALRR